MSKMKAVFKTVFLCVCILIICLGIGIELNNYVYSADENSQIHQKTISSIDDSAKNSETAQSVAEENENELKRTNILLLGVDARPGWKTSRSDTMILVSIDPELKKSALISIPRDTRVNVEGRGIDKICTANFVGGPELAVSTTENLMNIDIDHFVEVDFSGFVDIVDTLGGVEIDVEQRMYKPEIFIDLQPGLQRLNGKDALAFVRYRDYALGDINRTSQQQKFLKALADEVLQPKTITKFPTLAKQLNKYVKTDLEIKDILKFAGLATSLNSDSLVTQTLPGYFYDERDSRGKLLASYWKPDDTQMKGLIDNILAGKEIATITGSISVPIKPHIENSQIAEQQTNVKKDEYTTEIVEEMGQGPENNDVKQYETKSETDDENVITLPDEDEKEMSEKKEEQIDAETGEPDVNINKKTNDRGLNLREN